MTIRGITFPFGRSSTSLPAASTDDDVIADNLRRIMLTALGSRVMRPGSGSNVFAFVFENTGPILNARIDHEVRRAIGEGEPRAEVIFVEVTERTILSGSGAVEVVVDLTYRVNLEVRRLSVTIPTT